jgi:nucleoside-diphosphate-sugar epimerase
MSSVLVSGSSSGLGAYLVHKFGFSSMQFDRSVGRPRLPVPEDGYELIVHAAFGMLAPQQSEKDYIDEQVSLANNLMRLPSKKYIFISSIDVLNKPHDLSVYAKAKLEVEATFKSVSNSLILRPGALIGRGMRANQILKIARGDNADLTLSKSSTFSLVFYEDVLSAISTKLEGVYVLAANRRVTLEEIAQRFRENPRWGSHQYLTVSEPFNCQVYRNADLAFMDPIDRLTRFIERRTWFSSSG